MSDINALKKPFTMSKVNLDALIPREDFEILKDNEASVPSRQNIVISELEVGKPFLAILRKPDFQRETNEWTPEKISEFILSFMNDDLIPSIILWNSGTRNFVIDGAHRLSALISWVLNDYGDGIFSSPFFNHKVSPGQSEIAEKTRRLVKKTVGTYQDHLWAINNPSKSEPEMLKRALRLPNLTLQLQWVKGNADKAEDSFFKINEEAAPINDTERTLLKSRDKPNAIAARSIIRSGTGHKYWSKFSDDKKEEIEKLAKQINQILFQPEYSTPIKTLDVPLGGKGYSAETLSLVFDVVNVCNSIELRGNKKKAKKINFIRKIGTEEIEIRDDENGDGTIDVLKRTRKLLFRVTTDHSSSLGLHPAVYFYSITGRYQITSFLAFLELIKDMEVKDSFHEFCNIRQSFEEFLIAHKIFINQTTLKFGSGLKGYKQLKKLFAKVIEDLKSGLDFKDIINSLSQIEEYKYLNPNENEIDITDRKDFSTEVKSAVFLTELLKSALKCKQCKGYLHLNSIHVDHIDRKEDGGKGNFKNGQLMHPFCDSTIKN